MRDGLRGRHRWRLGVKLATVVGALVCVAQLVAGPLHLERPHPAAALPGVIGARAARPARPAPVRVQRLPPTRLIAHATLAPAAAQPHESSADFPDPFVVRTRWDYIAYATNNRDGNVPMRRSSDLRTWAPAGDALPILPQWALAGGTWAPAVLPVGEQFVMYLTLHTRIGHECIATATATNPLGPYHVEPDMQRACIVWDAIDPSPFVDTDGARWLLYKPDRAGRYRIDAQALSGDGLRVGGTAVTLLQPSLPWENGNVEGPSLARRDGILFLLYSANNYRNSEYRIGVATCTTAAGPCQPSPEPFLASGGGIVGPGGAEWVRDGTTATGQVGYTAWSRRADAGGAGPVRALHVIDTHVRGS